MPPSVRGRRRRRRPYPTTTKTATTTMTNESNRSKGRHSLTCKVRGDPFGRSYYNVVYTHNSASLAVVLRTGNTRSFVLSTTPGKRFASRENDRPTDRPTNHGRLGRPSFAPLDGRWHIIYGRTNRIARVRQILVVGVLHRSSSSSSSSRGTAIASGERVERDAAIRGGIRADIIPKAAGVLQSGVEWTCVWTCEEQKTAAAGHGRGIVVLANCILPRSLARSSASLNGGRCFGRARTRARLGRPRKARQFSMIGPPGT
jgi:hypothetical protein